MNPEEDKDTQTEVPAEEPKTLVEILAEESKEPETPEVNTEDESQYLVTIDKRKYADEIRRLEREDNHFKEVFRSRVGQRAAHQYKPIIEDWERRYNETIMAQQRAVYQELQRTKPQELGQYLSNNPQEAQRFAEVMSGPSPEDQARYIIRSGLNTILSQGINLGLSEDKAEEILQQVQSGKYDNFGLDANAFFGQLQQDVLSAIVESRSNGYQEPTSTTPSQSLPTIQQQSSPPSPAPVNPNLATGADVSGQVSRKKVTNMISAEEYERLLNNPLELINVFPTDSDLAKAIASGRIEGLGPNAKG